MSQGTAASSGPSKAAETRNFVAPLVAMGAVWGVKQALNKGYSAKTGHAPPRPSNRDVPIRHVVLWAGVTAIAVALVDVAVQRYFVAHGPASRG